MPRKFARRIHAELVAAYSERRGGVLRMAKRPRPNFGNDLPKKYGGDPMGLLSTIRLFASPRTIAAVVFERAAELTLPAIQKLLERQLAERTKKRGWPGFAELLKRHRGEWDTLLHRRVPGTRKHKKSLIELLDEYLPPPRNLPAPSIDQTVPHHLALLIQLYDRDPELLLKYVRRMRRNAGKMYSEQVTRGRPREDYLVRCACAAAEWIRQRPRDDSGELNAAGRLSEVDWKDVLEILKGYGWDFSHLTAKDRMERTLQKDVVNHRERERYAPCH
jgi:hypothetical protein